jgi:hypothetical protein
MDIRHAWIKKINITFEILNLIADINEFKGRWKAMRTLAPQRLTTLKRVAQSPQMVWANVLEGARLIGDPASSRMIR